ncbi:MAG TPA: glycosyltransferase [Candidatus Binataceae bacterium]|nr:glycosyltransferase [Candidatus Binataceae bacterium]
MKLSIIIATHDRPDSLIRLIRSLASQLRPGIHELFVAENGSSGPVALPPDLPPLKHLHDSRPGKCRIQNRAIKEAAGDILIFLDDDLTVSKSYLDAVERFFAARAEFAGMAGRILAAEDPAAKAGANSVYLDLPIFDRGESIVEVPGVLGANMAFRASALTSVGPFDERLGPGACGHEEETEMSQRLKRAGFRTGYAPEAVVYHEVDTSRADRERFIRVARERGRCRMLHEHHSAFEVLTKSAVAWTRLSIARAIGAGLPRIAREERRLAVARGMFDGLGRRSRSAEPT